MAHDYVVYVAEIFAVISVIDNRCNKEIPLSTEYYTVRVNRVLQGNSGRSLTFLSNTNLKSLPYICIQPQTRHGKH